MSDKNKVKIITSLVEFMEWTKELTGTGRQYLFRGVTNASYEIMPSACHRLPPEDRKDRSELLKINQDLIEEARLAGHDEKNGRRLVSDLELLAELQHFGAATCLIDFSQYALVALWFACQKSSGKKMQKDGKVFAVWNDKPSRFKTVGYNQLKKEISDFFKSEKESEDSETEKQIRHQLYQWQPKLQNNRILAQHSVFVFGDVRIKAESECVIRKDCKEAILRELKNMSRVTEVSLFPDFDGFARQHAYDKPIVEHNSEGYMKHAQGLHEGGSFEKAIKKGFLKNFPQASQHIDI